MPAEKSRQLMMAAFALVMVLAADGFAQEGVFSKDKDKRPKRNKAPEIDMNAATKGLATLATGFLLVGERLRRRR